MTEQAIQLHHELLHFPKLSPILLMRKTRQSYEYCVQLAKEIMDYRTEIGMIKPKKKKKIVPGNLVMFEVNRMRREGKRI